MTELNKKLTTFIKSEILNAPERELSAETELLLSGILDSMGIVMLVDFIDSDLGVEIPPEDVTVENFNTIAEMITYLTSQHEVAA